MSDLIRSGLIGWSLYAMCILARIIATKVMTSTLRQSDNQPERLYICRRFPDSGTWISELFVQTASFRPSFPYLASFIDLAGRLRQPLSR